MTAIPPIPPPDETRTEVHILRKDLVNVVATPPAGGREVQAVFDADGRLRLYVPGPFAPGP